MIANTSSCDTPNTKFFLRFARAVIPAGVSRFPNPRSGCHFRRHRRGDAKRPAYGHICKWIFGRPAAASKCVFGDGDVSVHAHVRLLLPAFVYQLVLAFATHFLGMSPGTSAGTPAGTDRDNRDARHQPEAGHFGDIYLRYIPHVPFAVSRDKVGNAVVAP